MELTNTQKKLLDEETQALIEAGFLDSCLKITDNARHYMEHLSFMANKKELVRRAKEKIAEKKENEAV